MKRYLALLAAGFVLAAALASWARMPRRGGAERAAPAIPVATLRLAIEGGAITPESGAVPKDHQVRLSIENRDSDTVRVTLAGYQDLLPPGRVAPGETWSAVFLSTRPGDDFAWLIEDRPAGRLRVTGSHLEEGHR